MEAEGEWIWCYGYAAMCVTHSERENNTFPKSISREERFTCSILLELFWSYFIHRW